MSDVTITAITAARERRLSSRVRERRPTRDIDFLAHIDVNVGDPMHPPPNTIEVPRLLGGELTVLGYPLAMVFAEKIVTAVTRGTQSTRWRDFADIYLLARRHHIDGGQAHPVHPRSRGASGHGTRSAQ
jgi:hypothetical protein